MTRSPGMPPRRREGAPARRRASSGTPSAPHAAEDEELLTLRRHAQLLAQLQQLDQRVRLSTCDLGARHRP